ncbi:MAG: murein hydrolase activator EnvC family protein [Actinomycetota bacterium]
MTRTDRSFPVGLRVLAASFAFIALAWLGPVAAAREPDQVTQGEVRAAKAKRDQLASEVAAMRAQVAVIAARLSDAAFRVDELEGQLEKTKAELAETRERIDGARRKYDRIRGRLNDRAAEAYIEGPGSNLEFLLGATSIADLSDRVEFVDAIAESDAELAREVENLGNDLEADEAEIEILLERQADQVAEAREIEKQIAVDLAEKQRLQLAIDQRFAAAQDSFAEVAADKKEYDQWVASLPPPPSNHPAIPLPDEWKGVLEVCPVEQPRAFGDGFGAPRYVGGYHLHKGVDIVAPEGTRIVAPFDGVVYNSTNSLGGIAVYVEGKFGRAYNAHMSSIARLGPVKAGDLIGYVSSTGLAGGTTPHDHFEFRPYVIPSGWPVSYYGYSVVEDSINPYPLLVDACG